MKKIILALALACVAVGASQSFASQAPSSVRCGGDQGGDGGNGGSQPPAPAPSPTQN